jgi:hypothetical protein
MCKSLRLCFVSLLIVALCAIGAIAQSQASTGQISGLVTDTNGAAVANATVKVTNKDTGLLREATASGDGLYTIVLLPPGKYTVVAEASGFGNGTIDDVVVTVGQSNNVNFALGAGGVQATVLVTAEAIQATRNESDAVLNETAITTLPINGRRFQDFVTLTPTAQIDPSRGQISLSGQKGINGNVNVDGMDYNQPFFGGIRGGERSNLAFTIPQESIREFQVVASGYSAEFGRSTGGIVNAVTKSGDNGFHGSAFYLYRPQQLARGNDFTKALVDQKLAALGITPTLAPTQHQFGGSVGGPIKKDKLFFFGAFEKQRFRAPRQIVFSIPAGFPPAFITLTAAQQEVLTFFQSLQQSYLGTNDAWAGLARIDWNISNNHRLNVRGSMSRNNALNAVSRGETSVDPTTRQALSANGTEQDKTKILVAQLVSNFGANVVNEMRFQAAREDRPRLSNSVVPQVVTGFASLGTGGSDTSSFLPNYEYDTRYQITDALTYIKGNHNFKFGGEYSRLFATQTFGFSRNGQFFSSLGAACVSATNCSMADSLRILSNVVVPQTGSGSTLVQAFLGRFDSTSSSNNYQKQIGNLLADMKVQELAFFGQDSWRVTPKLSINYGFRVEQQYNPAGVVSNTDIVNVVRNTIYPIRGRGFDPAALPDSGWEYGPRVGFAYDPEGKGKMVIRGFAGVYYGRLPLIDLAVGVNNYRTPPGNVTTTLPFAGFSQTTFNTFLNSAAGTAYKTITGCNPAAAANTDARNRCNPNSVYRQFAIIGINLNTFPLDNLPILTNDQISNIASGLGLNASPFVGAQVVSQAEDFKNPRSVQFGGGFEREISRGLVVGVDYANVSTHRISRFRDLNLPAPLTGAQYVAFLQANNTAANFATMSAPGGIVDQILASGRSYIAVAAPGGFINPTTGAAISTTAFNMTRLRPTQAQQGFALGAVAVHESTAKSLYRALTFRARLVRKRVQLNAYYTFSRLLSDDDNERQDGVGYSDPYDLTREYYTSRLNRESQFMANPIFFLPYGFEVSSAIRFRSGAPFNPTVGSDLNGDRVNNERPLQVPGLEYRRNYFTNRGLYDADLRVQKTFKFGERQKLILSTEFFNILNRSNLLVGTTAAPSSATAFGSGGQFCTAASQLCGLASGPPNNPNFLQVRDPATGLILINNINPGSQVFQMQLGVRFQF